MSGYTNDQLSTLNSLINSANNSLQAGDQQGALNYVVRYYNSQISMRGYATDALQVINNNGIFGEVANQELTDALGGAQYQAMRAQIAVNLATADLGLEPIPL